MNDGSWLIWVKVLGLVLAGVGFGWWQLRDVSQVRNQAGPDRPRPGGNESDPADRKPWP